MKKTVLISAPQYYGIDSDIREAFEVLGFNTLLINQFSLTILERIAIKIEPKNQFLKRLFNPLRKSYLIKENRIFQRILSKEVPDLLIIIKGDNFFPNTLERIKKELACPVVGYAWDKPFYDDNEIQDDFRKSNLKNGIKWYDKFFVFDSFYIDEIKRQGLKEVNYLPLATNPRRFKEISLPKKDRKHYAYDICFVGAPYPNREEIFESLCEYNLGVFGDYWTKYFIQKGRKTPSYFKGKATGEIVNKIYLCSKIVLNINDSQSMKGLNTRTFDIPACGAFEIIDYKESVEKHFEIDREMVTFSNVSELKNKIDFYLNNDALRKEISMRGKLRVLNEHTWVHRANEIITALGMSP